MDVLKRSDLDRVKLSGRTLQKAVGGPDEGRVTSSKMTVGFARYSAESGPMEPHRHAEETIYVVDARYGYVRPGTAANRMGDRVHLAVYEQGIDVAALVPLEDVPLQLREMQDHSGCQLDPIAHLTGRRPRADVAVPGVDDIDRLLGVLVRLHRSAFRGVASEADRHFAAGDQSFVWPANRLLQRAPRTASPDRDPAA